MWDTWYILAFISGLLCVAISIITFIFPNRKLSLIFRILFDVVVIFNGICIFNGTSADGIITAIVTNCCSLVRDAIFLCRGKYKWADHIAWLIAFELIFALSLIWTYKSLISVLPILCCLFNNVGLYLKDVKKTKILIIIGQSFMITYYAFLIKDSDLLTILSMCASTCFLISAVCGLIVLRKKNKTTI